MAESEPPYESIYDALDKLEDYLWEQSFSRREADPHVVRVVLRTGEQYQGKVRQANTDAITLIELPPHGATKRFRAEEITYLAVALPEPRRWWTIVVAVLGLADIAWIAARLMRPWLGEDSLLVMTFLAGLVGWLLWQHYDKPGSNLLPWVVTYREETRGA
jgi:hypothetical protein